MLVKVCGMRDADNIREVAQLGCGYDGIHLLSEVPAICAAVSRLWVVSNCEA